MKPVGVVMPFHGSEDRFRAASWVRQRYQLLHPAWLFSVGTDGGSPWAKARAVNRAVPSMAEIIIVTDADVAVPAKALEWAVARVADGAAWAVPYGVVYRLDRESTAARLADRPDVEVYPVADAECVAHRPPYDAVPGGGIFVVARDAWTTVRGFDERFTWGQEDAPVGHALDTLAGLHEQLPAPLWHLWHPSRSPAPAMYADQRLEARYLNARGDVDEMRVLIRERGAGPPVKARPRSPVKRA